MFFQDLQIFIIIQIAMILFACSEAYMEGKEGWKWNPAWWRVYLPNGYTYTAYHFFVFFGVFPLLLIVLPLLAAGWNSHLLLVLLFSYVVGGRVEDFTWFVVNPLHPLSKWNPRETQWYPWLTFGKLSLPLAYVIHAVIALVLLFMLMRDWV